ncbi:hypothetical protein KCP73_08105 [Salmonella enterica subsp. enterica]|nr:hypothetical protein KCP73_08105 [Salmonella enterica subsp. enterica]
MSMLARRGLQNGILGSRLSTARKNVLLCRACGFVYIISSQISNLFRERRINLKRSGEVLSALWRDVAEKYGFSLR